MNAHQPTPRTFPQIAIRRDFKERQTPKRKPSRLGFAAGVVFGVLFFWFLNLIFSPQFWAAILRR